MCYLQCAEPGTFFSSKGAALNASLLPSGVGKRKLPEILFGQIEVSIKRECLGFNVSQESLTFSWGMVLFSERGESLSNSVFP